ncbi:tetratricopeptide repeat protein [Streptomyces sp. NPDC046909]|uniref:tetratricopeptide repeat protein n=1 Tax=Streptomyces sp. NPDC046909 TaxID=3155617 RepID=UPI0033E719CC
MERAEELLRCHDPSGALERFDALVAQDPDDPTAHGGRIRALWALRRAEEARAALADAIATHTRVLPVLLAEGTLALGRWETPVYVGVYSRTQDFQDAAATAAFTAALDLDPAHPVALRGLCTAHRLAGRPAEARAVLDTAVSDSSSSSSSSSLYDSSPGLLVERALLAYDDWDVATALDVLDSALRAWPDDLEAMVLKAHLLRQADRRAEVWALTDSLDRHAGAVCPALEIEKGWLAFDEWRVLALEQVPDPDDHSVPELLEAARNCFQQALEALPGLPVALDGLLSLAAYGGLPDPELPDDALTSPRVLDSRGDTRLHRGEPAEALADYRTALSLAPGHPMYLADEAGCLRVLGRRREARSVATAGRTRHPNYPWLRLHLAAIEMDEGHYELAAQLYAEDGPYDTFGLPTALRRLECADTAEELARDRLRLQPRNIYLLSEYAECAYDQGHLEEALSRYRDLLEVAPENAEFVARKKQLERLAKRRFGWLRPPLPGQQEDAEGHAERAALIADLLPADTPLILAARLRALGRRQAAITNWEGRFSDAIALSGVALLFLLLAMSWMLLGPLGSPPTVLTSLLLVVAEWVVLVGGAVLVVRDKGVEPQLVLLWVVIGAGGLGAVLWDGHGNPAAAALIPALAVCSTAVAFCLMVGIETLTHIPANIARSRLRSRDRHTYLVHDLIDLLALLEYEPSLREATVRRQALDLLEQIARGQERVLVEPLGPQGRRSTIEESTGRAFRHHVAGIAAATRDLKRSVLSPGPETWRELRGVVAALLQDTVHARWEQLPHRRPDPAGQVLRLRILGAVRNLLVLLIPPTLVLVLEHTGVLPAGIPTGFQIAAYIGWPVIVVLLWLDPTLAKKIELLKASTDTLRSSFTK